MNEFFRGKKVLITGHTGFKGGWLARVLVNWGAQVIGVSLPPHTTPNLFSVARLQEAAAHYEADITNEAEMARIFRAEQPEIVFHLAAQALVRRGYTEPVLTYATNILGTAHVLGAIQRTPSVRAGIIVTTDKVYQNDESGRRYIETDALGGHDPYSASKAAADIVAASYIRSFFPPEKYGSSHQTLLAIARSGNVFGGGDWSADRLIPDIVRAVYETSESVVLRRPQAVRPWQHVLEPTAGYLELAQKLYEGETSFAGAWNFGPHDGVSCTVEEMTQRALALLGKGSYVIVPDASKPEAGLLRLDSSKARHQLGWNPKLDLAASLQWTFDWYKAYYETGEAFTVMDRQIEEYFLKN